MAGAKRYEIPGQVLRVKFGPKIYDKHAIAAEYLAGGRFSFIVNILY